MAAAWKPLMLALIVCGIATTLPPLVRGARDLKNTFVVCGGVFCDTCLAGFETPATTFLSGAKVRVECRDRVTSVLKCAYDGVTDAAGRYSIKVDGEHDDDICESVLVSSPDRACATPLPGRERSRIVLSHNNGVVSDERPANNLGFRPEAAVDGCAEIMKMYQLTDEDV